MSDRPTGFRHPDEPQWEVFELDGGAVAKISPAVLDKLGNKECEDMLTSLRSTIEPLTQGFSKFYRTTVGGAQVVAWAVRGEYQERPALILHLTDLAHCRSLFPGKFGKPESN